MESISLTVQALAPTHGLSHTDANGLEGAPFAPTGHGHRAVMPAVPPSTKDTRRAGHASPLSIGVVVLRARFYPRGCLGR